MQITKSFYCTKRLSKFSYYLYLFSAQGKRKFCALLIRCANQVLQDLVVWGRRDAFWRLKRVHLDKITWCLNWSAPTHISILYVKEEISDALRGARLFLLWILKWKQALVATRSGRKVKYDPRYPAQCLSCPCFTSLLRASRQRGAGSPTWLSVLATQHSCQCKPPLKLDSLCAMKVCICPFDCCGASLALRWARTGMARGSPWTIDRFEYQWIGLGYGG